MKCTTCGGKGSYPNGKGVQVTCVACEGSCKMTCRCGNLATHRQWYEGEHISGPVYCCEGCIHPEDDRYDKARKIRVEED